MSQQNFTVREAALSFLASLSAEKRRESEPETNRFIVWYGKDKVVSGITPAEVEDYAEWLATCIPDPQKKIAPVKTFLIYARQEGLISRNLAVHLKARKGVNKAVSISGKIASEELVVLTPEGYGQVQRELHSLREERLRVVEEVQKARADKDFKENAPLEAARERQGQVEARIRKLESALKSAIIMEEKTAASLKVGFGSTVVLRNLASGGSVSYTLVNPKEVDLTKGKISMASPLGKALLERKEGEVVEVIAPVGKMRYSLEKVE